MDIKNEKEPNTIDNRKGKVENQITKKEWNKIKTNYNNKDSIVVEGNKAKAKIYKPNINIQSEYSRTNNNLSMAINTESIIAKEIDVIKRISEFKRYLELFGYKPESTILQVHIVGYFNKANNQDFREIERRKEVVRRYGGTTFAVVGRTHDPLIMENVIEPKNKDPYERNPGYVGYLWKKKEKYNRAPHEILPLDFTPIHVRYPDEWKSMFATKGFIIAMHVPTSLAKKKNVISRMLYSVGKKSNTNVKDEWRFLPEIEEKLKRSSA